jgi:hypothetical protein
VALNIRRVVVENSANGKSVVTDDKVVPPVSAGAQTNISGAELWSTDMMPIDNSLAAGAKQKDGVVNRYHDFNYVGNGQGTTFRITECPPGHAKINHRTARLRCNIGGRNRS